MQILISKQLPGNLPKPKLPDNFTGLWIIKNPKTKEKLQETHFVNGKKHGTFKWWYSNGQIREECEYQNGQPNGNYNSWWQNGKKHIEKWISPSDDRNYSLEWWQNGQIINANIYTKNNKYRMQTLWETNGKLKCSGIYKNEKPWDGTFYVHQGGKSWVIIKYIAGKKIK